MKLFLRVILGIFIVLVLAFFLFRNVLAKVIVAEYLKVVTGVTLDIKSLYIGITDNKFKCTDLRLYNPKEYPEPLMMDAPEIYVYYDLAPFLKGKVHLKDARINLKEFVVVKLKKDQSNLDALKPFQKKKEGKPAEIKIDRFQLIVGKVILKDYSSGNAKPKVTEFNVKLNETYENINDANTLVTLIVAKALTNTTIGSIVDLKSLKKVRDGFKSISKGALNTVNSVGDDFKGTFHKFTGK